MENTFQQQYKRMYIAFALMAGYPAGLKLVMSRSAYIFFYLLSLFDVTLTATHVLLMTYYFLSHSSLPMPVFLLILRRHVIITYLLIKVSLTVFRKSQYEKLFSTWNEQFHLEGDVKRRQEILKEKIKKSYKYMAYSFLTAGVVPQLFAIRQFFDPYGAWTLLNWYPHSADYEHHFLFSFLHSVVYLLGGFGCCASDSVRVHAFILLSTQLQILQETLAGITQMVPIDDNGIVIDDGADIDTARITKKLNHWVKHHQMTIRWANDIKNFSSAETVNKYLFMGGYTCLLAFSVPRWMANGQIVDLSLVVLVATGFISMLFYSTRIMDEIYCRSEDLFGESLALQWYAHCNREKATFSFISAYSKSRPIAFRAFGLYNDSSSFFLSVLQISYKFLSFLMQVPDE